jgi:hypothetical protein
LPSKLSALLDQKLRFTDYPVIGPVSASLLREYVASCQPPVANEDQANRMLTRIANNLRTPRLSDDPEEAERMAQDRMETYRRALCRHALADLFAAYGQILRKCRFFPTIAEIEEIVAPIRAKRMARANRASMLIMKHEREWKEPQPLLTADEAARLGRILAAPLAGDGEQQ